MEKQKAQIKNWHLVGGLPAGLDPKYSAPEMYSLHLHGEIISHPRFNENKEITTSSIVRSNISNRQIETRNTIYELVGDMHPEFQKYLNENNIDVNKYDTAINK